MLDDREGWAVGVAIAPGLSTLWVAMNVRTAPNVWRPRIWCGSTPRGTPPGVEVPARGRPGRSPPSTARGLGPRRSRVRQLGPTPAHPCVRSAHQRRARGRAGWQAWTTSGDLAPPVHRPCDRRSSVRDGVAWIVGMSVGLHDDKGVFSRGFVVRMDIDTCACGPVIIAPPWPLDAEQVLRGRRAPGRRSGDRQRLQRPLRQRAHRDRALHGRGRAPWATRGWCRHLPAVTVSPSTRMAASSSRRRSVRALRFAAICSAGCLDDDPQAAPFSVPFPASKEDSEASAVAIDEFDCIGRWRLPHARRRHRVADHPRAPVAAAAADPISPG